MNPIETRCLGSACCHGVFFFFENQVMQDDSVSESAAAAQSASNAAGDSKVESDEAAAQSEVEGDEAGTQSDEAGAKSPSNAAGGSEIKEEKAGAESPSNAAGGAQRGEAGTAKYLQGMLLNVHDPDERKGVQKCSPSSYGLLLCSVEKKGNVFVSSKDMAVKEFTILYDINVNVFK